MNDVFCALSHGFAQHVLYIMLAHEEHFVRAFLATKLQVFFQRGTHYILIQMLYAWKCKNIMPHCSSSSCAHEAFVLNFDFLMGNGHNIK